MSNEMLSPREPLTDAQGNVTRTWWRFFNQKISQIGTTSADLVVKPSALLTGAVVSSGGTIAAADLPGQTLLGNSSAIAAEPVAVPLDPSLAFAGTALAVAPLAAASLLGNAGTVAAIPGGITIGSGLTVDPSSNTLSVSSSGSGDSGYSPPDRSGQVAALERRAADQATLLQSLPDRSGQVAALERKTDDALMLAILGRSNSIEAPSGSAITGTFIFTQSTASANWSIAHNLGKFPSVTVVDSANTEIDGDVEYIDSNNIALTFAVAFAGFAYLN